MTTTINESNRIRIGDRVSISPRGKRGIYTAEFWHNGRHTHRSLKTANQKIARQRAIRLETELAAGDYAAPTKPVSVSDARDQFIHAIKSAGRAHKTVLAYESETETFVQFLQRQSAHLLTQVTAQSFLDYRAERQIALSDKTLYTRLVIIKTFINWCCGAGELLDKNPLKSCKVSTPYVSPKFTPTPAQVVLILTKATNPRLTQYAALALTGLRVGELSMLRPMDVDLKEGWIHVVAREGWIPKTRQARKIPIHPRLMEMLKEFAEGLKELESRAYFFSGKPDGSTPINVRTINVDLQAIAQAVGIPVGRKGNGLVIHSLRHFFETQAVDSSVPQFVVDQWMGHRGDRTMGRTYYGHSDEKSVLLMRQVKF